MRSRRSLLVGAWHRSIPDTWSAHVHIIYTPVRSIGWGPRIAQHTIGFSKTELLPAHPQPGTPRAPTSVPTCSHFSTCVLPIQYPRGFPILYPRGLPILYPRAALSVQYPRALPILYPRALPILYPRALPILYLRAPNSVPMCSPKSVPTCSPNSVPACSLRSIPMSLGYIQTA
eukprot:1158919-Rhodomonas_salina.1